MILAPAAAPKPAAVPNPIVLSENVLSSALTVSLPDVLIVLDCASIYESVSVPISLTRALASKLAPIPVAPIPIL